MAMAVLVGAGVPAVAKRAAPTPVAPVVIGKLRFEAPFQARFGGQYQTGGIVVAHDAATGAELWSVQLYRTVVDPTMEEDVQDVFIDLLEAAPDGKSLLAQDERGRLWRVDLATHASARATGH